MSDCFSHLLISSERMRDTVPYASLLVFGSAKDKRPKAKVVRKKREQRFFNFYWVLCLGVRKEKEARQWKGAAEERGREGKLWIQAFGFLSFFFFFSFVVALFTF